MVDAFPCNGKPGLRRQPAVLRGHLTAFKREPGCARRARLRSTDSFNPLILGRSQAPIGLARVAGLTASAALALVIECRLQTVPVERSTAIRGPVRPIPGRLVANTSSSPSTACRFQALTWFGPRACLAAMARTVRLPRIASMATVFLNSAVNARRFLLIPAVSLADKSRRAPRTRQSRLPHSVCVPIRATAKAAARTELHAGPYHCTAGHCTAGHCTAGS